MLRLASVLLLLVACDRSPSKDAPPAAASAGPSSAPVAAAPKPSAPAPAASSAGLPFVANPADESSPITGTHSVDEVLTMVAAHATEYSSRAITMRGVYVKSGKDDGFPYVAFTNEKRAGAIPKDKLFFCQYDLTPGEEGPKFPKDSTVLVHGVLGVGKDPAEPAFILVDCTAKRDAAP